MSAIPEGFTTVTPTLVLKDAAKAIDLYTKAFGAKENYRMECPETHKIMHACIEIGDSKVFLADEMPEMCAATAASSFYLYMPDVDASFAQAKKAGFKETSPVQDMFWGDRTGSMTDSYGIRWTIATHKRDVSPEDMKKGQEEMMAKMKGKAKAA